MEGLEPPFSTPVTISSLEDYLGYIPNLIMEDAKGFEPLKG